MKKIPIALLLLLATLIAAVTFWLSRNMDNLVKHAIEDYGSAMTQAKVSVGAVTISPTDGKGSVRDLSLGNPAGFKTPHAMKVALVEIEVDVATLTKDVLVIRRIAIEAPDLIYENGAKLTNFEAIAQHIGSSVSSGQDKSSKNSGKRFIVEQLTVRNAKVQASAALMNGTTVALTLPDISLNNLGRAKGGLTANELGGAVLAALTAKLNVAISFDKLLKSSGAALEQLASGVKSLFK
jgi:uncharacterized protein involved in outer membrane biogenesis